MTLPTIEEQLEYLRAPGAPTAVDAWRPGDDVSPWATLQQMAKQRSLGYWARREIEDCFDWDQPWVIDARRALREREWREWDAGLVWREMIEDDERDVCVADFGGLIAAVYSEGWHIVKTFERPGTKVKGLGRTVVCGPGGKLAASRTAYDHLFPEGDE